MYQRVLNEYTSKGIKMKTELQSSVYKDRGYIFLKRYWYLQEPATEACWIPCKGGFQFTLTDNARDILEFAQECEEKFGGRRVTTGSENLVETTASSQDETDDNDLLPLAKRQKNS